MSKGFFGYKIVAKRYFCSSVNDAGNYWVTENSDFFFGYCTFHQLKSTITQAQFTVGVGFFGYTNSKVGIFLGIKYETLSDPPSLKSLKWAPWGFYPFAFSSGWLWVNLFLNKIPENQEDKLG